MVIYYVEFETKYYHFKISIVGCLTPTSHITKLSNLDLWFETLFYFLV